MAPRVLVMLALLAATALCVRAEADCLGAGETCDQQCPALCCSGMPLRFSGSIGFCLVHTPSPAPVDGSNAALENAVETESSSSSGVTTSSANEDTTTPTVEPTETPTPTPGSQSTSGSTTVQTLAPIAPATGSADSVNAFQSTSTLSGSRQGAGGATGIFVVVGALAGCVVLVAAVFYKKKVAGDNNKDPLEVPGSSYHGADGSGLTPDNRSLDAVLGGGGGGARDTVDSMKQLPVLSMAGPEGASLARPSSPFGAGHARISSPANRGATNEDYAFDVDVTSVQRPGSSVQVAFVDTSAAANPDHTAIDVEKTGVVAL